MLGWFFAAVCCLMVHDSFLGRVYEKYFRWQAEVRKKWELGRHYIDKSSEFREIIIKE